MNFNMYCYQNEWLIVDCGVTFKDQQLSGLIYLCLVLKLYQNIILKLKECLLHAHRDHIGAVHHLWPYLKCPIYLTPFSAIY